MYEPSDEQSVKWFFVEKLLNVQVGVSPKSLQY